MAIKDFIILPRSTATLTCRPKGLTESASAQLSASGLLTVTYNGNTKSASASLSAVSSCSLKGNSAVAMAATFTMTAITGFYEQRQGQFDLTNGAIKPLPRPFTWGSLSGSSWSELQSFQGGETLPIIWTSDRIDIGSVQDFCLNIITTSSGQVTKYEIYASETGAFTGEETITVIEAGDLNVDTFYGRYVYVKTFFQGTEMQSQEITVSGRPVTRQLYNINTATLSGTSSARVLSLDPPIGGILRMDIQVRAATSYAVNLYVSDTANSEVLIPVVKSKSATTPTFALYGIDNDARDGTVDITITHLPRQVFAANNLYTVEQ